MKKFLILCIAVCMLAVCFAACGDGDSGATTAPDTTPADTTTATDTTTAADTDEPHTHSFGEWDESKAPTCTEVGEERRVCACGEVETQDIPAKGHTELTLSGKAATCTEAGLTDGKKCSVCGTVTLEQTEIAKKAHSYADGACTSCGAAKASEGLEYEPEQNGESYSVAGIGTCKDAEIIIPETYNGKSVVGIAPEAFYGCASLTGVTIPASVVNICAEAFAHCSSLVRISVDKNNTVYQSIGNCLIETESKTLVAGCSASIIPDDGSVTSIGFAAFCGIGTLESITIPAKIESIGENAFEACTALKSINILSGVARIDDGAFGNCTSLESVSIPDSVSDLGQGAFSGCTSLASITIGKGVTSVGDHLFSDCTSLKSIVIPEGVEWLGSYMFDGCSALESITIGGGVKRIWENAFGDCTSLSTVNYAKSADDWAKIVIYEGNEALGKATIIYG